MKSELYKLNPSGSGAVITRPILRQLVAGLTTLGVLLQAGLLAVQLSILVAPKTGAADIALNIICTDHGTQVLPTDGTPSPRQSGCASCPLCLNSGTGNLAILPNVAIVVIVAPSRALAFDIYYDLQVEGFLAHPPSRGPPVFI
jgi:hypothetical protein